MSSHHFVRDGQEPSLVIANGESCSMDLLGQLLEWNPFVLVLDGALSRVLDLQVRFDAVLGDFDSVSEHDKDKALQMGVEWVHTPDQQLTDLQKGLEFLIQKGHTAANVLWATGRRADHHFNNLATLPMFAGKIQVSVIDDYSRVFVLPTKFRKWYPKGTQLSLLPINHVHGVSTSNLEFELSEESLHLPLRSGSSNRVKEDGFVEIVHEAGYLLLMECRDN